MMPSSVIILSNKQDAHIPFVTKHLAEEPIIIDFQEIIDNGKAGITFESNELTVQLQTKSVHASGIWLRRPQSVRELRIAVRPEHLAYAHSALLTFTDIFFDLFPGATWVSNYYAILRAENKPSQQRVAAKLGFAIPATLYTADTQLAQKFIKRHRSVIVKTLATHIPVSACGKPQAFYSRKVSKVDELVLDNLRLAPAIFQQLIMPQREFRVTVVGTKVFAAQVVSPSFNTTIRDWRMSQHMNQAQFHSHQLPAQIDKKCVALTSQLGLHFGAIDLIEDEQGTFWFLEINPNGQWAFVEQATGQPIGQAIADMLE